MLGEFIIDSPNCSNMGYAEGNMLIADTVRKLK